MSEVKGWVDGERDYAKLRGGTGPLVYPAGFVYIFAALRWLVGGGGVGPAAILAAQWVFLGLYLAVLAAVLRVYALAARAGVPARAGGWARAPPPWLVLLLPLSKRLHALYYLRLFNDCFSAAGLWGALALLADGRWLLGTLAWSAAVSVKMNGLLWLPALGLLLLRNVGALRAAGALAAAAALQVALGAPFLLAAPWSYVSKSFELNREFFYRQTVNWAFLPEEMFLSPLWARALLAAHLGALALLADRVWCAPDGGLLAVLARAGAHEAARARACARGARARGAPGAFRDPPALVVHALLASGFVGAAFARTLHYQFYAWYAQSLPLLLWAGGAPLPLAAAALAAVEAAFNVGDERGAGAHAAGAPASPALLQAGHAVVLGGLFFAAPRGAGGRGGGGGGKPAGEPAEAPAVAPADAPEAPAGAPDAPARARSSARSTPARLRGRAESAARVKARAAAK